MTMSVDREKWLGYRSESLGNPVVGEVVHRVREWCGSVPVAKNDPWLTWRVAFYQSRFCREMTTREQLYVLAWLSSVGPCDPCSVQGDHTGCEPAVCDCSCNDLVQLAEPLGNRSWARSGMASALTNSGSHWAMFNSPGGQL